MERSIRKNFIWNAALTASSLVFPLVTFPYASRILTPVGTGKVALGLSVISYFELIAQLGIPIYGIRACAAVREDREKLTRTAHELFFISLMTAVFSFLLLVLSVFLIPRLREEKALYLLLGSSMLLSAVGAEWLYKALEEFSYIAVRSLILKAVALGAIFLLIRTPDDYVMYGGISVFALGASGILNFISLHRHIAIRPVGGYRVQRHFKAIAVFFGMACATTVYTHLDTVMLGFMGTDAEVGYYTAAVKVKSVLVGLVTSLGAVLLPRASFYIKEGRRDAFRRIGKRALRFVLLLALPLSLYFILFAEQSILLLCGEAYAPAILPMQIIMPTLLLIGITNLLGIQTLVPLGKERGVLYSVLAGAGVNIALNALLIPGLGASGAALGTLASEAVVLAVQVFLVRREGLGLFSGVEYAKLVLSLGAAGGACLWISLVPLGVFLRLILSAFLFFGVYGGMLLLTREKMTREAIKQAVGAFRRYMEKGKDKEKKV